MVGDGHEAGNVTSAEKLGECEIQERSLTRRTVSARFNCGSSSRSSSSARGEQFEPSILKVQPSKRKTSGLAYLLSSGAELVAIQYFAKRTACMERAEENILHLFPLREQGNVTSDGFHDSNCQI